jgi:dienelactone hydrolase
MMIERPVEYEHDGDLLEGSVVALDDGPRPGVLLSHAWCGRGDFEMGKARRLAEAGYAVFALDMYGKGVVGASPEECAALMAPWRADRRRLAGRQLAALDTARDQPEIAAARIAAIGFCFGGLCVLDLARAGADVAGVVSFHGIYGRPDHETAPISAKVLILHGRDDPMCPPEDVLALEQELNDGGVDWQLHAYGHTMHAFTNPAAQNPAGGTQYNEVSAVRAWTAMLGFLEEVL